MSVRPWALAAELVPAAVAAAIWVRRVRPDTATVQLARAAVHPLWGRWPLLAGGLSENQLYRAADRAAFLVSGRRRCLPRSLLVFWLLARRGEAPVLCIGVAMEETGFLSHAWIENQGYPVGESEETLRPLKPILRVGATT